MADLRIAYDEEMVGSGHPTKEDTLNRLVLAEHNQDGTHNFLAYQGLSFTVGSGNAVTIHGDGVVINGALARMDGAVSLSPSGLAADAICYLMAATPGGTALAAGDFSLTTTAPAQDHAKGGGWYSAAGSERCIGWVPTDGSGNLWPCLRIGSCLNFLDVLPFVGITGNTGAAPTSWTAISVGVPNLGMAQRVYVWGEVAFGTAEVRLHARGGGSSMGTISHSVLAARGGTAYRGTGYKGFNTNTSGQIDYISTDANAGVGLYLVSAVLPEGM